VDAKKQTYRIAAMYTNLDSFNNKRRELDVRIAARQPDIIGFTEINPKHATWELATQDLQRQGYNLNVYFTGRGSVLYVKD